MKLEKLCLVYCGDDRCTCSCKKRLYDLLEDLINKENIHLEIKNDKYTNKL